MKILDIGEVSRQSGVAVSTLRYYEEVGLIRSTGRNGLRRQFDPEVLQTLSLITLGKSAGFSLDEIRSMFGKDGEPDIDRQGMVAKADELDRQVKRLEALSNIIRHVAECPAPSHMECPSFQRMITIVQKRGAAGKTKKGTGSI